MHMTNYRILIRHFSLFVAEQSSGFNLDFEVSGIYAYVLLDGVLPSLNEITCAFWMKSTDTTNYGTPISYAVENGSDNAFLLTDYNGYIIKWICCCFNISTTFFILRGALYSPGKKHKFLLK